jgi:MFS family permease
MASANIAQPSRTTPTNAEKMRALKWNYVRNAANTFFTQFTFFGPAFILFLNELNLNKSQIGLLLSFFPFMGAVSFILAPSVGRFGYKKTWLAFFSVRKIVTLMLLLVPYIASRNSENVTLLYVGSIVLLFGLCRAISETAIYPWLQEIVPNSIRGRYSALNNIVINVFGVIAVVMASWILELGTGLSRFTYLFTAGVAFGLIAVWASTFHPGGASTRGTEAENISQKDILKVLRDMNFVRFVAGLGMVTLATTPMFSFLPLFMQEQIGLSDSQVVLLQNGALIGSLSATYLAGWAADRYGSKPVMLSGLWMMMLLPIGWMLMPENTVASLPIAASIAFMQGAASIMWGIGSGRMLYVSIVPFDKKAEYMGIYYTLIGLIGGVSQLVGGRVLDFFSGLSGAWSVIEINEFTPLFVSGLVLLLVAVTMFRFIHSSDREIKTREFAGLFLHGNPFMAFESMFRYYRAKDEHEAVVVTERLGQAHSLLTLDELLEALQDPRFFVRFEAVVSIARSDPPDPRYVEALTKILHGTELSLTVLAAWALGRIGDANAIDALRLGMDSQYRSIRAHCSRALGTLGDTTIAPELLQRLEAETDAGLQMAYAAALGSLQCKDAITPIIHLMHSIENEGARMELALSLARIAGNEPQFIRLLRELRQDCGTSASQFMFSHKKKLSDLANHDAGVEGSIMACSEGFGREDMEQGIELLAQIIEALPKDNLSAEVQAVLAECIEQLRVHGVNRLEYLVLVFDILESL